MVASRLLRSHGVASSGVANGATPKEGTPPSGKDVKEKCGELLTIVVCLQSRKCPIVCSVNWRGLAAEMRKGRKIIKCRGLELPTILVFT